MGFPTDSVGKEFACNAGDPGLILGSGRSPGEKKCQLTAVFSSGKSKGQRNPVGYSSWARKSVGHDFVADTSPPLESIFWTLPQRTWPCQSQCGANPQTTLSSAWSVTAENLFPGIMTAVLLMAVLDDWLCDLPTAFGFTISYTPVMLSPVWLNPRGQVSSL